MIKFLKVILTTLCLSIAGIESVRANDIITGTSEIPMELNLLISFVQYGRPELHNYHLNIVTQIDSYARVLSKEDIFLLGKVEIYKALLKNYSTPEKAPLNGESVAILDAGITRTFDNFIKWFLTALRKDVVDLINNPVYKEFLLQGGSNKNEKLEYRKVAKKAELLQYWITRINPKSDDFTGALSKILYPNLEEALKNISNAYLLMARESATQSIPTPVTNPKELKFFKLIPRKKSPMAPKAADESKSVEEILAPITETAPVELPKPTDENWLLEENNPPALQNLPKPTNDADWLQDF